MINNLLNNLSYKTLSLDSAYKFIEEVKSLLSNQNVIVWGGGISGRFYSQLFKKYDVSVKYFIDLNAHNLVTIDDKFVYLPDKLKDETDKTFVIAAGNPTIVDSIVKYAKSLNLPDNIFIFPGDQLLSIFKCSDCLLKKQKKEKIVLTECSICNNLESDCVGFKALSSIKGGASTKPDFGMIGYILGQVCTLRCKHCCESVPYMRNPIIVETSQVIKDIKKMSAACNTISRMEFIGGEPFLHNGLVNILEEVINTPNIGYGLVFTNATVMPSPELVEILKHPKIVLNFSGYKATLPENLRIKVQQVKDKLEFEGVNFAFYNSDSRNWMDINHYERRELPDEVLKEYHQKCFMYVCHRVFNGEFYGCPHQYSGIQLGKIKKYPYEFIEIHKLTDQELSEHLIKFKNLDFTEACRYCNLPYDAEVVPAALQL